MPASESVEDVVNAAVDRLVQNFLPVLRRALVEAVASAPKVRATTKLSTKPTRRRPRGEMTHWVADNRARRVPTFVIEATGLDTKKKIVAKFGAGAAFDKGKPLPTVAATVAKSVRAARAEPTAAARVVKAQR